MKFSFKPEKITHVIGVSDGVSAVGSRSNYINLDLKIDDNLSVFELGDSYVISSSFIHQTHHRNKKLAQVSCTLKPISLASAGEIEILRLSSDFVGNGIFFEESSTSVLSESACLLFTVYIPDVDYISIINKLDMGIACDTFALSFEDESGKFSEKLKYGWEPDGSRIIWNYSEGGKRSKLCLTSYTIAFNEPLRASDAYESEKSLSDLMPILLKDLKEIKYSLYLIACISMFFVIFGVGH